jgi:hypothetical protein
MNKVVTLWGYNPHLGQYYSFETEQKPNTFVCLVGDGGYLYDYRRRIPCKEAALSPYAAYVAYRQKHEKDIAALEARIFQHNQRCDEATKALAAWEKKDQ